MSTALQTLTTKLAGRLDMGDNGQELINTLKQTAFKGEVSDAQMTALMVIANQYGLNPWTKEIYAFPDKRNGIVPVVGVDGWARIINDHPEFDGIEFEQDDQSCTVIIYRKDRSHPIKVTEYFAECKRATDPWRSHPKRMMRHKALIQGARIAFGYGGIYDQDEAERIIDMGDAEVVGKERKPQAARAELPAYTDEQFKDNFPAWQQAVNEHRATPQGLVDKISLKYTLSEKHSAAILGMHVPAEPIKPKQDDSVVSTQDGQGNTVPDPGPDEDWLAGYDDEGGAQQ